MTHVPGPPHLTLADLVDTLRGAADDRRDRWVRHLSELCPECWNPFRSGLGVRFLVPRDAWAPEVPRPDPVAAALFRLLSYFAPETTSLLSAGVLRPLYWRHRRALVTAHKEPFGLVRLVLEESRVVAWPAEGLAPAEASRLHVAREAVRLVPAHGGELPRVHRDLRAWGEVCLARALHRQGATAGQVREHVYRAVTFADRGTGDALLRATLLELRGLPGDVSLPAGLAFLDRAVELASGAGAADLEAELLLEKARRLTWNPEEQVRTCREALKLLGTDSPPGLRLGILDECGTAEAGLGHTEAAWRCWMAAQRWSESAGEAPLAYCRRWERLARLPEGGLVDTAAARRAASWGYRSLSDPHLRREASRLGEE